MPLLAISRDICLLCLDTGVAYVLEPDNHQIRSPQLSQEEAESQLAKIGEVVGAYEPVEIPWLQVLGTNIISANLESDPPLDAAG